MAGQPSGLDAVTEFDLTIRVAVSESDVGPLLWRLREVASWFGEPGTAGWIEVDPTEDDEGAGR